MPTAPTRAWGSLLLALLVGAAGCRSAPRMPTAARAAASHDPGTPVFTDVAAALGVQYRQETHGKRPLTILEANGSGCGFLDFDNDGWLDLILIGQPRCALYRNLRGTGFQDVTAKANLAREGHWIGCAAGDYDNDGDTDLFVTGYETCALYRNNGAGRFDDVTRAAHVATTGYQSSAAFGDVDRDGLLDLYVCRYVQFGPGDTQYCPAPNSSILTACGPDAYLPQIGVFYRNAGNGTFVEATRKAGLHTAHGKAWGAAFGDFDDDGWQDLCIANDEMPGDLFHNQRGRMVNVGEQSGFAYSQHGSLHGGMGVDFGDYDNDRKLDLVVTTFWLEPNALYRNDGAGTFAERSYAAGIATPTRKRVGFGTRFVDVNQDGWLDLFFVNGHVQDASEINPEEGLPERMQLLLNRGKGRFTDVSENAGEPFLREIVGRGAAFGDFDNDGDQDAAVMDLNGNAQLLRNEGTRDPARQGRWLELRILTLGGSDALGARVTVEAGGMQQVREVQTSGSLLSSHDPRPHFGLGPAARADQVTVRWPDGTSRVLNDVETNQLVVVQHPGHPASGRSANAGYSRLSSRPSRKPQNSPTSPVMALVSNAK